MTRAEIDASEEMPVAGCPHHWTCEGYCTVASATDEQLKEHLEMIGEPLSGTLGHTAKRYVEDEIKRRAALRRVTP